MTIRLQRRAINRAQAFISLGVTYGIIGFFWQWVEVGIVAFEGVGAGLAVGIALALLEQSSVAGFTRSMPFSAAVLVKSGVFLGVIAIPLLLVGIIGGLTQGSALSAFLEWMFSAELVVKVGLIYLIHLGVTFFRHLNKLLGPGTLMRYVTGKYHRPRVEKRVFMFLDLKSSTTLAETLGAEKYYAFLNTFFRDMSDPILDRAAEIYQYVGDEVVLTWPVESGIRDANCIRVFVEILAQVHSRRDYYKQEFGHVPEFKAGVHVGDVITAEIGDIKKDIVYSGDVLNTTARIQAKCNELGQLLIASEELASTLELPNFITPRPLGRVELRGKAEPTALVGLV